MHEILKDVCHLTTCNLEPSQLHNYFFSPHVSCSFSKRKQFSQKTGKPERADREVYAAAVITIDSYVRAN